MIYNLDRDTKHRILEQYKRDALIYRQQKQNERLKRIQEEREFILDRIRKEKESELYLRQAKLERQKDQMKEYYDLIKKLKIDKPGYFYIPHNRDVVNKNWGNRSVEYPNNYQIRNNNNNIYIKNNISYNRGVTYNPIKREGEYVRKRDNMKDYLTDRNNNREVKINLKQEKQKRMKYYKDILDLQNYEIQKNDVNEFGTIDPIIIRRVKKNSIIDDPYNRKRNYNFGDSMLSHNPITNPENDIFYNKYLLKDQNTNNNNSNNINIYRRSVNNNNIGCDFNNQRFKLINNSGDFFTKNRSLSCIDIFRNNDVQNINQRKYYLNNYNDFNYHNIGKNLNNKCCINYNI